MFEYRPGQKMSSSSELSRRGLLLSANRGSFPGKSGWGMKLTAHLNLTPWLQMGGAVPLLLHDVQRYSCNFGAFTVSDSERYRRHIC